MVSHAALVTLSRGSCEEVTVYGELVVSDHRGLLWSAAEAVGLYPVRSLLKPFQFLACNLPPDRWQLSHLENLRYAPCLGSISATMEQIEAMETWYRKGRARGLAERIQVPSVAPLDSEKRMQAKNRGPQPIYSMCFSKHAAAL